MEILKGETPYGRKWVRFGHICDMAEIVKDQRMLRFSIGDGAYLFTQEDIQAMLPYLQSFAETGKLEGSKGESR
jgi:hypothetical protein